MSNIFTDVKQNTPEWFNLRLGKITSSNVGKIMANCGKAFGDPAIKYAEMIALEYVTGKRDEGAYTNKYMDRGHELEPQAVRAYEDLNSVRVKNGGFYHEDSDEMILVGDSNDGNVGNDGCIEIKSVIPNTHWKRLKKGGIDSAYKWQIHSHLWIGEKQWCDFISYCPEMPRNKRLFVCRVDRDEEMIEKMKSRVNEFRKVVEDHINILKED